MSSRLHNQEGGRCLLLPPVAHGEGEEGRHLPEGHVWCNQHGSSYKVEEAEIENSSDDQPVEISATIVSQYNITDDSCVNFELIYLYS